MKIPKYVTIQEVKRVCKELRISDWTKKKEAKVSLREAKIILSEVHNGKAELNPKDFKMGLEVELEHGLTYKDANVTNNHPLLTGKIVLAHLKETLDYYTRLEVAELEGDILKAVKANKAEKVLSLYKKLLEARLILSQSEVETLS